MKRRDIRSKLIVLAAAVLACVACAAVFIAKESKLISGVPIGEETEKTGELEFSLLLDGLPAPYDEYTDTYYIPQTLDRNGWSGKISAVEGFELSFAPDEMFGYRPSAVEYCHVFTLYVSDGVTVDTANIMFTGLPTLCLESEGEMRLFCPDASGRDGARSVSVACEFHVRGYESDLWPKQAYKLTLFDENGAYVRTQLLGMRPDDDWLLMPMYGDRTKIREKLSLDIWNQIAADAPYLLERGSDAEYVEVFIDGDYAGLYLLAQRLDGKLAGGDADDTVYLFDGTDIPTAEEMLLTESFFCRDVEIRSTHLFFDSSLWENCILWTDAVYRGIGGVSKVQTSKNICDYYLFSTLASAPRDGHQSFCLVAHDNYGEKTFVSIPTDMKYSFGSTFSEIEAKNHTEFDLSLAYVPANCPLYAAFAAEVGAETAGDLLSERYAELSHVFSEENLLNRAEKLSALLTASGALARDSARWPGTLNGGGRAELETYISARLAYMDAQFGEER
ncbi:MAG: CotH kinase family protein [Clostridia bacterium]|nr:CotH kinase family protein [Clostridia bacterium]